MFRWLKFCLILLSFLLFSNSASARPDYLGFWSSYYLNSNSDNAACQLCHERPSGGNGWNNYGISVRSLFLINRKNLPDQQALIASLEDVENFLTDLSNSNSPTFLDEINANTQPGWRVGEVNEITVDIGNDQTAVLSTISPPTTLPIDVLIDQGSTGTPGPSADPQPSSIPRGAITVKLNTVAEGFVAPVYATPAPNQPGFLYVVEQHGKIWKVDLNTGVRRLFLDISNKLVPLGVFGSPALGGYDERGLLGVAFHPNYADNNKFYTYISEPYQSGRAHFSTLENGQVADHQSVVSEWIVVNPMTSPASATNERALLIVDQPQFNHNGGMIDFGPDGLLYIAFGDGGSADDQGLGHGLNGNGRDPMNPLGAILRIDVDSPNPPNGRYSIPQFNPFRGLSSALDEVIAYGFRNPYRFSFEPLAGNEFNIYVGDVGQNAIEEIDLISSSGLGGNYGWNYKEGSLFFYPPSEDNNNAFVSQDPPSGVALPNLVEPIAEYDHDEGISVIGGYVYNGSAISELSQLYVFADYTRGFGSPSGRLFYLDENQAMREFTLDGGRIDIYISGFGKDLDGELYVVGSRSTRTDSSTGVLQRIELGQADDLCVPIKAINNNIVVVCL